VLPPVAQCPGPCAPVERPRQVAALLGGFGAHARPAGGSTARWRPPLGLLRVSGLSWPYPDEGRAYAGTRGRRLAGRAAGSTPVHGPRRL